MSEYTEVEQPFLQQLQSLGWAIIDQGQDIPSDPAKVSAAASDSGCCRRFY
jgi:type I restriction enzyme R subunit